MARFYNLKHILILCRKNAVAYNNGGVVAVNSKFSLS
jgi:hypothetical protein